MLIHKKVFPRSEVNIEYDETAFQKQKAVFVRDVTERITLKAGESITLDFGRHLVGVVSVSLESVGRIADSPIRLKFSFGETPYEMSRTPESVRSGLGIGWLQFEERAAAFLPAKINTDRRYAFRYMRIERTDTCRSDIAVTELFCDAVSAVRVEDAPPVETADAIFKKIYAMSVFTLAECEQEVFEDGPKRDRRLWIGDLRLQALTDSVIFKNKALVEKCIGLFADHLTVGGRVAPCVFPDSPPFVDDWYFADYSVFFVSCIWDHYNSYKDIDFVKKHYGTAYRQIEILSKDFETEKGETREDFFIDWCSGLDKSIAGASVYRYVLKQALELAVLIGEDTAFLESELARIGKRILSRFDKEKGLFVTENGQISCHSQIWAVLSGVLSEEENRRVLSAMALADGIPVPNTPYMMHYYLEALFGNGMGKEALNVIKDYWGAMVNAGYDCFPEVFKKDDEFVSPYADEPVFNSACHAWSCTPAYWLKKYEKER